MVEKFDDLYDKLGYHFQNEELLRQALTHKSHANENASKPVFNNERLEFLGDAVLDIIISETLMERFADLAEGGLSKIRAGLVSESGLSRIAEGLNLGQYLRIGKGEELTGGRQKVSILSDAFEALVAAIYLDSGGAEKQLATTFKVVERLFEPEIPKVAEAFPIRDFKTELQEYVQKQFHTLASYRLVNESGPDHQKTFEVVVVIQEKEYGQGIGSSKKQAEQNAAKLTLEQLLDTNDS